MTRTLSCAVMMLAVRCLGDHRRDWAMAMEAEFDIALTDGKPLRFAAGCLYGALQELPLCASGRFTLVSYALALGLMVPIAAVLVFGVLFDFPYSYLTQVQPGSAGGLNAATRPALSSLAILIVFLGVGHLRVAWDMVERDWTHVAVAARANAAITVTLAIFTSLVFSRVDPVMIPAGALILETGVIAVMTRWHGRLM